MKRFTRICRVLLLLTGLVSVGCKAPPTAPTAAPLIAETAPRTDEDSMTRVGTLFDAPEDFARVRIGTDAYPIPPYAEYLKGVRICLDPGHGGQANKRGYKRGPTGVREAEVNLRVANYLRDFLEAAGAIVKLTRTEDVHVSLAERAEVANRWGADLFISCHHNAISGKPQVNRTSVWHHNDVDYHPSDLDLARYLCQGLMQTLAFPQITGVPLKSDQLMYPAGFGVLRHADVTAALAESSFFTNPQEEQRLRTPEHNLDEAYGMFIGLARYVYAGLPRVTLVEPADGRVIPGETTTLTFELDDGLRARKAWGSQRRMILTSSLDVRLDGQPLPFTFTNDGYVLTAELPDDVAPGGHRVDVQFVNMLKNSVINPHVWIDVAGYVKDIDDDDLGYEAETDPWLQRKLIEIDRRICRDLGIAREQRACGVLDLTRGRLAMIRPDVMFYAASVPKIVILLAYFEAHPEAAADLDPEIEHELGLMIKRSDNALAAKYSRQLGLEAIRDVVMSDAYRLYDEEHGGGLWMGKHYAKNAERLRDPLSDLSHAATVRQCIRFYWMLERGRLVSPEASDRMKAIFASPSLEHHRSYFVNGLADRDVTLLRKSGTWEQYALDTALVERALDTRGRPRRGGFAPQREALPACQGRADGTCYILVGMTEHPRGGEYLERLAAAVDDVLGPGSRSRRLPPSPSRRRLLPNTSKR